MIFFYFILIYFSTFFQSWASGAKSFGVVKVFIVCAVGLRLVFARDRFRYYKLKLNFIFL